VKIMKITAEQTRMLKALAETGDFYAGSGRVLRDAFEVST
jgi:hypothetical protein